MRHVNLSTIDSYLSSQSSTLNHLAKNASKDILDAAALIHDGDAAIICVGVGKSAMVAAKFSATLRSFGRRSILINGSEALHGDLGFIRSSDIVVFVSKSGTTGELSAIHAHTKALGCKTIAVFAEKPSLIGSQTDVLVHAEVASELDHLNIIPTNSTLAAMACLDAIAAAIALEDEVTESEFSEFHPAGSIGKETTQKVVNRMIPLEEVGSIRANQGLLEAASLLTEFPTGLLLVKDDSGEVVGILTDGDFRRAILQSGFSGGDKVSIFMNPKPIVLKAKDSIRVAKNKLKNHKPNPVGAAPVENENSIVGVTNIHLLG